MPGVLLHKPGGAVKAVTRGNGLVEGYLISFGSPNDADLEGQWFTPRTDIREDYFKDYPLLFHHGMDRQVGLDPIGRVLRLQKDNVGWHAQAQIDLHDRYGKETWQLLEIKPLGWSSGAVDHLVVIAPSGEILVWPLFEGTITPTPAQPRKTTVRALKALLKRGHAGIPIEPQAGADTAGIVLAGTVKSNGENNMGEFPMKYVKSVLKMAGFRPTKAQFRAIMSDLNDPATLADDEFDPAMLADDEFADPAAMADFEDEAILADDEFADDAMMSDFEEDPAMLADDEFDPAMMSDDEFGDDAMMSDFEEEPATMSFRKSARPQPRRAQKSAPGNADVMGYIRRLEAKVKSLEMQEAPGERNVGMKSVRVTRDRADQKGAYKSVFEKYIRGGEFALDPDDRNVLRKGETNYGPADSQRGAVKALTTATANSVGFSVPDDFVAELNRNVMVDAVTANECKRRTTTSDTILIPDLPTTDARRAYSGRVTWVGETASGQSESDVTPISMGQIQLPIHVMLVSTVASLSALEDSAFDLQSYITEAFSEMIAIEYEELIWSGNGQGKMRGIVTDTKVVGAASTGVSSPSGYIASGSATTIADPDKLMDFTMHLPPQYRSRAKWFMNSNTANVVRKLKDGNGRYLWGDEQGLNRGTPTTLLDRPIVYNEWASDIDANAYPIAYGDLSRAYTIANRVEFSVKRFDDSTYATQDNTLLLGRARLGGMVTQPLALKVLKIATS